MSHQYQQTSDQYGEMSRQQTGGQMSGQTGGHQMGGQQPTGRMGSQQMTGPMGGQQMTGRQTGGHQARSFEDHMTDELRIALEDFGELSHVAAWCAKECAADAPELGICARICQDVAEIAALNEMLIARDSMFGPEVAELFLRIGTEALAELQRFEHHPHVVETMATIDRTMNSCETVLQQVGGQQMGTGTGGQQMSTGPGGQMGGGMTEQMSGQSSGQYGEQRTGGSPRGGQMTGQQGGQMTSQRSGQSTGRQSGEYGMQGLPEQGQYGQGMSDRPTGEQPPIEQRY